MAFSAVLGILGLGEGEFEPAVDPDEEYKMLARLQALEEDKKNKIHMRKLEFQRARVAHEQMKKFQESNTTETICCTCTYINNNGGKCTTVWYEPKGTKETSLCPGRHASYR
jgi:radical SAM protein with 4Fe4S-binding SPASM domain